MEGKRRHGHAVNVLISICERVVNEYACSDCQYAKHSTQTEVTGIAGYIETSLNEARVLFRAWWRRWRGKITSSISSCQSISIGSARDGSQSRTTCSKVGEHEAFARCSQVVGVVAREQEFGLKLEKSRVGGCAKILRQRHIYFYLAVKGV